MPRPAFVLWCLVVALSCRLSLAAAAQSPKAVFAVSGSRILKNGSEFVIRGVSVAGPGAQAKRPTVQDVDAIASLWKFNLVRVGCSIAPKPGLKQVNDLDEIVRTFTSKGVVVLIDPRDHVGSYYQDPAAPPGTPSLNELVTWYKDVATRYRSNPFVWFTAMSGPGSRDERKAAEPWRETHVRVIDAIRKDAAATNIIVCEGRYRGNDAIGNGALPVAEASSTILSIGPELSARTPNLLYAFHIDETWNAGAPKLNDFLDRIQSRSLPVFVSEYANSGWADSTPAIEAMLSVCKARHIGRCVWSWFPSDNQRLCAPDEKPGGWQVDTTDGSKPGNLSWVGELVWDDNHGLARLHGAPLDRSAWTATSFVVPTDKTYFNPPDAPFSPYITQDDYWSSNKAQEPGQWFQIDMGAKQTFSRMMIDPRARLADYPRGYELYVSNDGTNWGAPVAKGKNDQSVLRLTFPVQSARYIKVVQTGKTWHHWVIANVEVYAPIGAARPPANPGATASDILVEPRAWTASCGPNRWYDVDLPLRPLRDENRYTSTSQAQRPGHYYQVDMGEPQRFHKIVLNSGRSLNDYPRGYEVQVSSDGETWSKPVASGRGAPITTITFPPQTARYLRVTLTRPARNYWALAEFRVFRPAAK